MPTNTHITWETHTHTQPEDVPDHTENNPSGPLTLASNAPTFGVFVQCELIQSRQDTGQLTLTSITGICCLRLGCDVNLTPKWTVQWFAMQA